jgi:small subunit ribosomal protein S20
MAQGTPTKVKKRKKSVLKRAAQSASRNAANRAQHTRVRSAIKAMRGALRSGNSASADQLLRPTLSAIDRAVAKGILARNAANRHKSRLSIALNSLKQTAKT